MRRPGAPFIAAETEPVNAERTHAFEQARIGAVQKQENFVRRRAALESEQPVDQGGAIGRKSRCRFEHDVKARRESAVMPQAGRALA